jgi:hypothetical protein
MTFENGHNLSPGRPKGSRNKRTSELLIRLDERGDIDPADFLSSIVTNEQEPKELRIQASGLLLPYMHSKLGTVPAPRFLEIHIIVPTFTSTIQAEEYLNEIPQLLGRGEIDSQTAMELSTLVKNWIDSQYAREELNLKINPPEERDQTIRVTGGLPALPGTSIDMPVLNGHAVSEQLLSAPTDVVPQDAPNEFTPAELKAQGSHPLQPHHFAEPGKNSAQRPR